jgi:predicted nuclease of predicted toxin-antitoxin system
MRVDLSPAGRGEREPLRPKCITLSSDLALWDHAKANGFAIVSQGADFAEMAALLRPSPKVIWLRVGNQSTAAISILLRHHADLIAAFGKDDDATCLEILA